jgi:ATP-dependent helicase Lhr and Lhr-like helicase
MNASAILPVPFAAWFATRNWSLRPYQAAMIAAFAHKQSTLLIAPTGGGKTLSGFLPSLIDLHQHPQRGLHTLYISPLKALTNDIQRNLMQPVAEMNLAIEIETRTGDTPAHKRARQRSKPPHILLTTPESLMLMLSYADAPAIFGSLHSVIIDEVHSFAHTKRGDFTALALARLRTLAPEHRRFGLSATVADPEALSRWLGTHETPAALIKSRDTALPDIRILQSRSPLPYGGHMAAYAVEDIYEAIKATHTALVFVNTRAQCELMFQNLWDANVDALPIAIYHGSLSKEQRRKTEAMMAAGTLRAIVATSALELGIDWGKVDLVIQIGAPKGVSRLLQRIGRSNHRMDEPSRALLVPSNRFDALECAAALEAIKRGELDGEPLQAGALDILPQFIMNCACSAAFDADILYEQIKNASPYRDLSRSVFDALLEFTINGGYALKSYDRFQRLQRNDAGLYEVINRAVSNLHRQNIGVITDAGTLKVKRLYKAHQGRILGEVEEYFAQQLTRGDTFLFAGEVLAFEAVEDMTLEAWPAKGGEPKIPSYVGSQMPLSTFLADGVKHLLGQPEQWHILPDEVRDWLHLQQQYSLLPDSHHLLVEHFPYMKAHFTMLYTFEGRKAHQTLGMLLTRRMERTGLHPISFSITDYGLSIASLQPLTATDVHALFKPDMLGDDLEEWIMESPMLKRSFRHVASISGLTMQRSGGNRKNTKQVTFSTDLIYDVLRKYDKNHILLNVTRQDAERELLDIKRLNDLLMRYHEHIIFKPLPRISPMAIPIVLSERSEQVRGSGIDAYMQQLSMQQQAEMLMEEVKDAVQL